MGRKPKQRPEPLPHDQDADRLRRAALGQRIKETRDKLGWSLRDLAVRSGFHRNELLSLEAGEVDARLGTITRLAAAMGCGEGWLLAGVKEDVE